jgi:hypothetical protein
MTTNPLAGRRVRLLFTSDPYTRRQPGAEGTVRMVDSLGTVFVSWDDGGVLGLVPGADQWEILPTEEPEPQDPGTPRPVRDLDMSDVEADARRGEQLLEDEGFWTHDLGGEA